MNIFAKLWAKEKQRIVVVVEKSEEGLFDGVRQVVFLQEQDGWKLRGSKNIFDTSGLSFSSAEIGNEGVVVEYERIDAFFQSILIFTR